MERGNAGKSWADGPGLTHGQTKKPCNFTIHSVDADGKPIKEGGDPFEVKISGPEKVTPQFKIIMMEHMMLSILLKPLENIQLMLIYMEHQSRMLLSIQE